jgi:lipopolysaccharide export system permease protein
MKQLDRYVFGQFAVAIGFTLALLVIIWLAPETLFKLVQGLMGAKITLAQFGQMLLYHIPPIMQQCVPMAILLGSLFAVRRLSLNLEWSACLTAGISPVRLWVPVLALGLMAAVGQWLLQEVVIPYTSPRLERLYQATQLKQVEENPFLFVQKNAAGSPEKFFFIGDVKRTELNQFIVLDFQHGQDNSIHMGHIYKAATGKWLPQQKQWLLQNGLHYQLDADGVYKNAENFDQWLVPTSPLVARLLKYEFYRPMDMSRQQLTELISLQTEAGQTENLMFYTVRLWQKWTPIIACLLFGLFGVLLGKEPVRSKRQDSLLYGALVLFVYGVSQPVFSNLGSLEVLPPWLSAAGPIILCALITSAGLWIKDKTNA